MKIQNKEANHIEVQKIWSNLKSLITFDAQLKIALIIILPTVKFSTGAFPNKILFCFLNSSQHVHAFAKYYLIGLMLPCNKVK